MVYCGIGEAKNCVFQAPHARGEVNNSLRSRYDRVRTSIQSGPHNIIHKLQETMSWEIKMRLGKRLPGTYPF